MPIPKRGEFFGNLAKVSESMEPHTRVQRELAAIPVGEAGSPQQEFRATFNSSRLRDLGGKSEHPGATPFETIEWAAAAVRKTHPDFTPEYDHEALERIEAE